MKFDPFIKPSLYGGFVLLVWLVNAVLMSAHAQPTKVLTLGDSLTAGYGLPQGESFADQLERALIATGHDIEVINGGVSGDTTQAGLARLNWVLLDNPDLVIVELGANDGLRGLDPQLMSNNLAKIIETLQARDITILLAGMLAPPNLGEEYGREYNAVFPALASKYNVSLYPFFLEGVAGNPDLNLADGIHPTVEGVGVVVERILPFVQDLLAE